MRSRLLTSLLCLVALCGAPFAAQAAPFPTKPIRWIVPFPPGGAADIVSRAVSQKLDATWGQQIVIDNRPGAGGNLGIELASHAAPDGYTVVIVPATFTTYPSLTHKPIYETRDFAPITLVASSPLVLVVNPAVPAKNVKELIAYAKAHPRALNYASSGIGASAHMAAELFKASTHTDIVHVPYKGQPPAMIDLISGRVQMMFANIPAALPHVKAGKLRALAVTTEHRSPLFPQVPTVAESGIPGFSVDQWSGLVAPAGTPAAIVADYQRTIAAALHDPEIRKLLTAHGFEPVGDTPAEFKRFIAAETVKWRRLIRQAHITAD